MKSGNKIDIKKEALKRPMEKGVITPNQKNNSVDALFSEQNEINGSRKNNVQREMSIPSNEIILANKMEHMDKQNAKSEEWLNRLKENKRREEDEKKDEQKTEEKDTFYKNYPQSSNKIGDVTSGNSKKRRKESESIFGSSSRGFRGVQFSKKEKSDASSDVRNRSHDGHEYNIGIDNDVENGVNDELHDKVDDDVDDEMDNQMSKGQCELCDLDNYENDLEENNVKDKGSAKNNIRDNSIYSDTDASYLSDMNKSKLNPQNDSCCCFMWKGKKYSNNNSKIKMSHDINFEDTNQKKIGKKDTSNELKNMDWLIYTIRYMDYRRLRRRFNGIRKPISKKIVFIITIFCLILISWKYFKTSYQNSVLTISFKIKTSFLFFVEAALAVIGVIIFAKFQTRLSLHWPIYASYIFIICACILLIFYEKDQNDKPSRGEHILMIYGIVQLSLIIIVKIIICIGPILAIYGFFCPCTEHCRILKKKISTNKLNITISRYNDFAGMCGNNFCCLCLCAYRTFYRIINCFYKRFSNLRFKMANDNINEAPFSHQLRYKGKTDIYGRPHGYGEWIEDHSYGEKLRGFWFHGYPVGPFISQEVGSGSLFVNTRVGFAACVGKDWSDVRYGVSCTECSISGHFFNDFPLTHFFNPKIEKNENGRLPMNRYDIIVKDILKDNYEDILGYDLKWCFNMLKVNSSTTTEYFSNNCMISVDHVTMSLKVHNYKRLGSIRARKNNILDEITVKLVHIPKEKKNKKNYKNSGYYPYLLKDNNDCDDNNTVSNNRFVKYDEQLKCQENEEFFYTNQHRIHNSIKKINEQGYRNYTSEIKEDKYHSFYTHKLSDKLLNTVNDDIYLYKMNKSIKSTEMHNAPHFYDPSVDNDTSDTYKTQIGTYRAMHDTNNDSSSLSNHRMINYNESKGICKSDHKKEYRHGKDDITGCKSDVSMFIKNEKTYESRNLHGEGIYRKGQSNNKKCYIPSNYKYFTENCYTKSNSALCQDKDTYVVNINSFDRGTNLYERGSSHEIFGEEGERIGVSEKERKKNLLKKESQIWHDEYGKEKLHESKPSFFSQNECETFNAKRKEILCDSVLPVKFREDHIFGLQRDASIENKKKNANREGEANREREAYAEMDTNEWKKCKGKESKPEEESKSKGEKEQALSSIINERNQVEKGVTAKNTQQYEEEGESKQNDKKKIPVSNERKQTFESEVNEVNDTLSIKSKELKRQQRGEDNLKGRSNENNEMYGENKTLFISDIFKSFIKSGISMNSRNKNMKSSNDNIENNKHEKYIEKRRKSKKSKRSSYLKTNKDRKDTYNKSMKKVSLHRMKNSKIKGLVKKYTKQYRKGSIYITSNNKKVDKTIRLKYNYKSKNTPIISTLADKVKSINESFGSLSGHNLSTYNIQRNKTIAQVFAEEDEWENYRHKHKEKIIVEGWQSLSLKQNLNFMPDEIVIYIHGYNVKLHHGCSQLAHLVSFSKLPSYIQPFVFHWEGAMWGAFSALSYPVARKRSEMAVLGNSFKTFIQELINSGIKNVHIISHSCGSRLFFNGFASCVEDNLFYNVLKNEKSKLKKSNRYKDKSQNCMNKEGAERNCANDSVKDLNEDGSRNYAENCSDNYSGSVWNDPTTAPKCPHNKKRKKKKKKKQIIVKTVILLNPDYPLDKFLEKDFFVLRSHCNHIVMYGDTRDQALTYSETWNREKCLGKRIFKLKLPLYKIYNSEDYMNLNLDRSNFFTGNYEEKYKMCDNILFPNSSYVEEKIKEKQSQYKVENMYLEKNQTQGADEKEKEENNPLNKFIQSNTNSTWNDQNINKTIRKISTYDQEEGVSCISEDLSHNYLNENFLKTVEFSDSSLKAFTSRRRFRISKVFKEMKRKWLFKNKKENIYFNQNTMNRHPYNMKIKEKISKTLSQTCKKTDTVYISFDKYAWLDMDVIDTTFVETNVDFLKHSFYQVKREIIDDIREVLISNIRAHERVSRLDRRRGNVFVLRVAPAVVGSLHR
ncbi:hypothetical protein, conserved [Plasmodium gonderi]|uniref:Uncharacterized protein n=1 Tax=Plasmodium gonderi TaxID=77519 RepID=A0A1Y1JKF1_PLAGO|nr:hypothetical protein, conserved [Plasmodium gonderi]GAW81657.1 hypothetical protein, conserved [Plasmodium gonderi]